jgi:oligopeptidase A
MYHESATRASEFGKPEWDNTPLIAHIVALRRELAHLLGFNNYAEYSLVPKMARSPAEVLEFLDGLARRARPYAERDIEELREYARTALGLDSLEAWDLGYASEKLRAARYAFSDQEVKEYFPEDVVLDGLFRVAQTLYGIRIARTSAPLWHPDVRFFRVADDAPGHGDDGGSLAEDERFEGDHVSAAGPDGELPVVDLDALLLFPLPTVNELHLFLCLNCYGARRRRV